jgi:hypothetical protein
MTFRVRTALCLMSVGIVVAACGAVGQDPSDDGLVEEVGSLSESLTKPTGTNGDGNYCNNPAELCVAGEGDCDAHAQCTTGYCGLNNGPNFGFAPGSDVCVPRTCQNKVRDGDETQIDCGGSCGTVCGAPTCNLPNGSAGKCTSDCPCAAGEGDCNVNSDCQTGLCRHDIGASFGFAAGVDMCVAATCGNGVLDAGEAEIDCGGSCGTCPPPLVYFTEYTEGSGTTRGLEIYNATSRPISCTVRTYLNGSPTPTHSVNLSTPIAARSTRVICHPSSAAGLLALCNQTSSQIVHGGDDAVELVCSGARVDVIGQIGFDPGTEWGSGLQSTADNTIRRRCGFTGDRNGADAFVPSQQWDGFAIHTFDNFGIAPVCP